MKSPRVVLPGVVAGVLLLAVAVAFAVFLPKAHGETTLVLPDKLPGGYVAADLRAAYEGIDGATDEDKATYATAQVNARKYSAKAFKAAGVEGVARNYLTKDGSEFIAVQLIRADGGALSPYLFTDPATASSGTSLDHYVKAGHALCIETGTADGSGNVQQSVIECQRSEDGLTLQVTTQSSADDVAKAVGKIVDSVWDEVA
ncbi:MAG: hypothetical protein QM572_09645 [Nocardioides sp.]|uniref:hypothetical protein n=1 Tax=Nocardioides sp. TaxID=35761 RepID=UPI0039E715F9